MLTEKLAKDASEEIQVVGGIVPHCRRKRFHKSIHAEYTLKKLQTEKEIQVSFNDKL